MMQPGIFMEPGTARLYRIIRRNAMISGTKSDGFRQHRTELVVQMRSQIFRQIV